MKQIILDTKFNRDYFVIGNAFVVTKDDKQTHGLLLAFDDDQLCFTVIGCKDTLSYQEPKNLYISKESVECGETIIRQACAVADTEEGESNDEKLRIE